MTAEEKIKEVMELVDDVVQASWELGASGGVNYQKLGRIIDARYSEMRVKLRQLIKDDEA